MRLDQPLAKFNFKLYWNRLCIDFFHLIPAVRSIRHDDSIRIRTIIISKNSIYIIKNLKRSNWIDFFDINWLFWSFNQLFWLFNWLFWSFDWLFQSFNWLFRSLNWSFNRNRSKIRSKMIEIAIVDSNQIGLKSTIEFGFQIRFDDDDSIRNP